MRLRYSQFKCSIQYTWNCITLSNSHRHKITYAWSDYIWYKDKFISNFLSLYLEGDNEQSVELQNEDESVLARKEHDHLMNYVTSDHDVDTCCQERSVLQDQGWHDSPDFHVAAKFSKPT